MHTRYTNFLRDSFRIWLWAGWGRVKEILRKAFDQVTFLFLPHHTNQRRQPSERVWITPTHTAKSHRSTCQLHHSNQIIIIVHHLPILLLNPQALLSTFFPLLNQIQAIHIVLNLLHVLLHLHLDGFTLLLGGQFFTTWSYLPSNWFL